MKLEIRNLKGIKCLDFEIPINSGVFLIAGSNGSGKTTLLTCLDKICNSLAFAQGFPQTSLWSDADQYDQASITYIVNGNKITYQKSPSRWTHKPKTNTTQYFRQFNFSESVFVKADSRRIDAKIEDLKKGNLEPVSSHVKNSLNEIFDTTKYDKIQRLKNSNGRGRTSTYFYVLREGGGASTKYFSEKRFSTGELAMIRLVEKIESVSSHALILLDEAELALHPKVQVKLLEYLRKISIEKQLKIFISTHSPSMLKSAKKEEIFLLSTSDKTEVTNPCYPAAAIGSVDFATSNIFDYVLFVEDDMAQEILLKIRTKFIKIDDSHASALCNIIPVGGYYQTALLAVNTEKRLFGNSKVFALVDGDAFDDLDTNKKKANFKDLYEKNKKIIRSLTFTPEQFLIEKLESKSKILVDKFVREFNIELDIVLSDPSYTSCSSNNVRTLAKKKLGALLSLLPKYTSGRNEKLLQDKLIELVVDTLSEGEIKRIMNPIFS